MSSPTQPTLNSFMADMKARLIPLVGEREARASLRMIFESVKGWTPVDLAVKGGDPVSSYVVDKVTDIVNRMATFEPLQYILGETWWYGLRLKVTPAVLIPRPETAELVDLIVKEAGQRSDLRVADICTGSGCIALALARNLPFPRITAIDISPEALDVARQNAAALRVRSIDFEEADATDVAALPDEIFDIIVANPPYIADHERAGMEKNVLLYEPHKALFVPDSDPLLFYRSISTYALSHLAAGGRIYFEINPLYADLLAGNMREAGWNEVSLIRDIHGTNRFLSAVCGDQSAPR